VLSTLYTAENVPRKIHIFARKYLIFISKNKNTIALIRKSESGPQGRLENRPEWGG
jgi:hypothetical protein